MSPNRIAEAEDILIALGLSPERADRWAPHLEDNGILLLASVPAHYALFPEPPADVLAEPEALRAAGDLEGALEALERLRGEAAALGDAQLRDALGMRIAYGMVRVHADKREWREARFECKRALQLWGQYPWLAEMRILPLDQLYGVLAHCCESLGYGFEEEADQARELARRFAPNRPGPSKQPEPLPEVEEVPPQPHVKVSTSTPKDDPKRKKKGKSKF
ncbi:hypothetical protein HDZ31DRAFT_46515 [Schizophyllum fasciatum]